MKYILTIVTLGLSLMATNVSAGTSVSIDGTVLSSTAIVKDVVREVPEKTCTIVEVPVYGNTKGTAGDAIAGAIIGGVLGNQVGKGSGKDAATIFGAILGAKAGENNGGKKVIVGYKQVEQCEVRYVQVRESVVSGYETSVELYGELIHTLTTKRQYNTGSIVPVRITLSLN